MHFRILAVAGIGAALVAIGVGCDTTEPCQEYVDYVCACHGDDTGFDCETLRQTYANASSSLQDQCAIDKAKLEQADQDAGATCAP